MVTLDMPVSTVPIVGRRAAESRVSMEFGNRGCAAHSPGTERPGKLGAILSAAFGKHGYSIATTRTPPGTPGRLVEVYPHTALLALVGQQYRVPYKVSRSSRYWPKTSVATRIAHLLNEFEAIQFALGCAFGEFTLPIPKASLVTRLAALKRHEDALDALICCWMGTLYLEGKAIPLGDGEGAIWCPSSEIRSRP